MKHTLILAGLSGAALALVLGAPSFAKPGGPGAGMHRAHWEEMDTNKDGQLSRAEAEAGAGKRFEKMDLNGDGKVTPQEMTEAREKMKAERMKERQDRHFKQLDANGDGSLSKEEMSDMAMTHFNMADTNEDGVISKEEHEAARKTMREKFRDMRDGPGDPEPGDDE